VDGVWLLLCCYGCRWLLMKIESNLVCLVRILNFNSLVGLNCSVDVL